MIGFVLGVMACRGGDNQDQEDYPQNGPFFFKKKEKGSVREGHKTKTKKSN